MNCNSFIGKKKRKNTQPPSTCASDTRPDPLGSVVLDFFVPPVFYSARRDAPLRAAREVTLGQAQAECVLLPPLSSGERARAEPKQLLKGQRGQHTSVDPTMFGYFCP